MDTADPDLGIINVTGLKCVGVPIGTPEFVDAFVRSKIDDIQQDVQKLRIIQDPKIHYDLLRFCQHTRIAFLARNVHPDVMMKPQMAILLPRSLSRMQLSKPFFSGASATLTTLCLSTFWNGVAR